MQARVANAVSSQRGKEGKISWNVINSLNDEDDAMTITTVVCTYTLLIKASDKFLETKNR